MPDPKKYDMNFRPATYFDSVDTTQQSENPTSDINGSVSTDEDPASSAATPRTLYGSLFLPPREGAEVEIARVQLESTTFDIISVRARLQDGRIFYSIVDEYEGQFEYTCKAEVSEQPLTMAELIDLMETTDVNLDYTGLVLGMIQHRYEYSGDAEQWVHFANVTSDLYPQLGEWYFEAMEEWYEASRAGAQPDERREV